MAKKRRKDIKVKNTDGISRVKPIKNVGTDPDTGKKIQNVVVKRADGATITTRYADGEKVGETYQPKKMKKKRIKKLRTKRMPRPKKVKAPSYTAPEVTLDEDAVKEVERRERVEERNKPKNKIKRTVRRTKNKVSDAIKTTKNKVKRVFKKRPKARKVKNLVTGGYNKLR